ncbi:two-component system osmolarity sensor histidine kinase EnvZ [Palleronia aestuarii]|uniref:histidine kinase n=1 Tax=Palleronia aestuarii TaxID=568105 RepID=A0A2W7NDS0_9RHOB|nr:ATP-binding protein [Palleronia aestuarii]PZX18561.1 two-component system osmolarity sensor histidine kinase EnvZ [Palleronia aestuarii]
MTFDWLKRYVPRSLYGRAALILLLPVVTIQLVVSVVFIQRLFEDVTEQMTDNVVLELARLVDLAEAAPDPEAARVAMAPLARALEIESRYPDPDPVRGDSRVFYDLSGRLVIRTLRASLDGITGIELAEDDSVVELSLALLEAPIGFTFDRNRVSAKNPHQLLVLMIGTSLLMTIIAYLFLRNQIRPIRRLAEAATAFGRGRVVAYRPAGATEVRSAGAAFLDMRQRITRQIDQRTMMLSGISHDLRTPLTRLRLGLSLLDEAEAEAMTGDVAEMQKMLDAFLDFARDGALDDPVEIDPAVLLRDVAENASRAGQAVRIHEIDGAEPVVLRPLAITRALDNLVGNAVRYGDRAELSLAVGRKALVFTVEDNGPGIPEAARADAIRPFSRLDPARNQDRGGGVGLGLSIAMDIARQHGGTLRLEDSERLGGLRADLVVAR